VYVWCPKEKNTNHVFMKTGTATFSFTRFEVLAKILASVSAKVVAKKGAE